MQAVCVDAFAHEYVSVEVNIWMFWSVIVRVGREGVLWKVYNVVTSLTVLCHPVHVWNGELNIVDQVGNIVRRGNCKTGMLQALAYRAGVVRQSARLVRYRRAIAAWGSVSRIPRCKA